MPRRRIREVTHRKLIEQIAYGERSAAELAREHGISLERLALWASEQRTVRALRGLANLADIRAQMLLTKYRANAAVRLIQVATADEPTELSRKACVDLLNADMGVFYVDGEGEGELEQAMDEAVLTRALEALGRGGGDG